MTGYVYLVWAKGTDLYKIGSSQYPEKRLPGLQTGSPLELEMIAVIERSDYEFHERQLHSKWAWYRTQGEWFKFHPTMVTQVLSDFDVMDSWTKSLIDGAVKDSVVSAICEFSSIASATQSELMKTMKLTADSKARLSEVRLILSSILPSRAD